MKCEVRKMKKMINNTKVVLVIILIFGFVIRFINIWDNPISMYGDELTMVYDTYSILKTGYDQTGQYLPLTFKMGENRPVGYGYFSIPFVTLFGTTALGIRMLSVLSGVGLMVVMFLLGRYLFSRNIGLITAGMTAFSFWDIALSRGGFETHFALFLATLGIYLFLRSRENPAYYIASAVSFALSMQTYSTFKLTVPLMIIVLIWYMGYQSTVSSMRSKIWYSAIAALILVSTLLLVGIRAISFNSESRFASLNIFSQHGLRQELITKINNDISNSTSDSYTAKLFHNKPVEYLNILINLYIKNFSPDFLFLSGDRNPRHNMATMGQMNLSEIITIFFGLVVLIRPSNQHKTKFIIGWLLLAAIPPTLLMQPHALRGSFMLPPLILISSLGVNWFWRVNNKSGFIFKWLIVGLFLLQFVVFMERTLFVAPNQFSRFWSFPAKLGVEQAIINAKRFDYIILSDKIDNMEYAYPVYAQLDPRLVLEQNNKTNLGDYNFRKYGNVYIGSVPATQIKSFVDGLAGSVMFVGSIEESESAKGFDILLGADDIKAIGVLKKEYSH